MIEKDECALKNNIQLELILVDDASNDNSLKIAQELSLKNPKIKVFSHKKNQGKGAALKTGIMNIHKDLENWKIIYILSYYVGCLFTFLLVSLDT